MDIDAQAERRQDWPSVETIVRTAIETLRQELSFVSADEHAFIKTLIKREQIRAERWEKIKTQVLGWGVIAVVGWIGSTILNAIRH